MFRIVRVNVEYGDVYLVLRSARHLLRLLLSELCKLLLPALLAGLKTSLGVEAEVPPAEAGRVVTNELLVVQIVVVSTSPERQEMAQ